MTFTDTMDQAGLASQAYRMFKVRTPLAEDTLLFRRMTGTEQLGRLYEFDLEMLSEDPNLAFNSLLGEKFTVTMNVADRNAQASDLRYYSGYVSRFSQVGTLGRYSVYRATLRPWLWFLTRGAKCRIFEQQNVTDIVTKIFREYGFSDFELSLSETYEVWEYRVQYRETDFNFVSRLLEEEGIYYFFKQEENRHKLVLADSISAHPTCGTIPYFPPDEHGHRERDHIANWAIAQEVQPKQYATRDFNFALPSAPIDATSSAPITRQHGHADGVIHDFTTELYIEGKDPKPRTQPNKVARARIEELQAQFEELQGAGDLADVHAGVLFKLQDFPREDQNREYAVTGSRFELVENEYETGILDDPSPPYTCSFTAIDRRDQFRPARITPKAIVQGPHTAIVVGGGEGGGGNSEIWTDKYGRVRVQFHWERDSIASCWIRVSQAWAGQGWGAMAIPRIGQEVIVEFLEGDPDRPIITGRVYNGSQTVPYTLPDEATKTTFKSNSSPGGGGFNEWRFEDKAGSEEIYIHAQKDMNTKVLNDKTEVVDHDRTREVGNNETLTVKNDRTRTVKGAETVTVTKDQSITVTQNQTTDVTQKILIKAGMELKLECGASSVLLKADGTITIKGVQVTLQGEGTATVKSTGKTSVEGTGMLELKSTGIASLQGSLVKIN